MNLSIVDLAPVRDGESATEAYEHTTELARIAEQLGYSRFWAAEHHGLADSIASTTPEVLIAHLAAKTNEIRVGSGTVLLNHYSPFKVAETFSSLDALAPGRVDLGLGRATGMPAVDRALGTERRKRNPDRDHAEKIEAAVSHLYDGFDDEHPYAEIRLARPTMSPKCGCSVPAPRAPRSPESSAFGTASPRSSDRIWRQRPSRPTENSSNHRRSAPALTNRRGCSR